MKPPITLAEDTYTFDEPITTPERVMDTLWALALAVALFAVTVVIALPLGYYVQTYQSEAREARCINSACDAECQKTKPRFKRHTGECK